MRPIVLIVLILIAIFIISAYFNSFSVIDVSSNEPFSEYIAHDIIIKRDMELRKREESQYGLVNIGMVPPNYDIFYGEFVENIPTGTKIEINEVKKIVTDGYNSFYAIGKIKTGDVNKDLLFEIAVGGCYRGDNSVRLRRMPWEDNSVPEIRITPWDGC